jgi:hypothetical protein
MKWKLRLFGAAVLLFNLWLIGRYDISGAPVLLMTFGFAVAYEYLVVKSINNSPKAPEHVEAPAFNQQVAQDRGIPTPEPQESIDELAEQFGIIMDGGKYRYKDYAYDRLGDAIAYAKIDRSRPIKCE